MPSGSKASPNGLTWPCVKYSTCEPSGRIRYVFPDCIVIGFPSAPFTSEVFEKPWQA